MALDLGKQVGPLPLGAWIVVIGTGVGIAYWNYKNNPPAPTEDVEDTSGVPGVGDGSVGGWTPTQPPAETVPPQTDPTTNEEWARRAINYLIAQNYDATLSDSAIRKYIAGIAPSITERALIGIALTRFGSPPQPLPPTEEPGPAPIIPKPPGSSPPVKPPPAPPKPPPVSKPHVRYYTVVSGDNLWNISKKYYGNGALYGRIFNANRYGIRRADGTKGMIKIPSLIYPKWRLIIP